MHARRTTPLLVAATAGALLAMTGAQAATSIAITSPAAGTTFSRASDETITVTGTATFGPAVPENRTFYLRGSGCGATEAFWLSVESGTDEYDGCGTIGGLPFNEVIYQLGGGPNTFAAQDGIPAILDASKNVTGTIRAESWTGDGTPGVGQVVVEVSLSGADAEGNSVTIGSDTLEAMNTGTDGVQLPFTFDIGDSLDKVALTELTLSVEIHGVNQNSSNLGLSGDSKFTLPVLDAGLVEVSSDSSTFSASKTVKAELASDGTWTAEIPTPAIGASRKIHARAVQGGVKTTAAPVGIVVTA